MAPARLAASFVGGSTDGVHQWWWHVLLGLPLGIVVALFLRAFVLGKISRSSSLLLMWVGATCTGPLIFDALMRTHTSTIERYALAGMPAAFLLIAESFQGIAGELRVAILGLLLLAWLPRISAVFQASARGGESFREVGRYIDSHSRPDEVIIVDSIPSGVLGVARYLSSDTKMASWVGRLGNRRVPEDIRAIVEGHSQVVLAKIHSMDQAAPEEIWLRANARLVSRVIQGEGEIFYFVPVNGSRFLEHRTAESIRAMPEPISHIK
jgi:hypothetical protein